jgi:hypothetical protein
MTDFPHTTNLRENTRRTLLARVEFSAFEYRLLADEVKAARKSGKALVDFALRHNLSLDWLILGDLHGLLRQVIGGQNMGGLVFLERCYARVATIPMIDHVVPAQPRCSGLDSSATRSLLPWHVVAFAYPSASQKAP